MIALVLQFNCKCLQTLIVTDNGDKMTKPAAVHALNGNPGKRQSSLIEPQVPLGSPEMPDGFPPVAAEKWEYTIKQLSQVPGMLALIDRDMLEQYCLAHQMNHDARQIVKAEGMVCYSEKGSAYQHPMVGVINTTTRTIMDIGKKFCLTPCDRVGKQFGEAKKPEDPISMILNARAIKN